MHRITISLPDELASVVADQAERDGTSVSEVVRRAVVLAYASDDQTPALPFAALGRSGQTTTARDAEAILAREWTPARHR